MSEPRYKATKSFDLALTTWSLFARPTRIDKEIARMGKAIGTHESVPSSIRLTPRAREILDRQSDPGAWLSRAIVSQDDVDENAERAEYGARTIRE